MALVLWLEPGALVAWWQWHGQVWVGALEKGQVLLLLGSADELHRPAAAQSAQACTIGRIQTIRRGGTETAAPILPV